MKVASNEAFSPAMGCFGLRFRRWNKSKSPRKWLSRGRVEVLSWNPRC